MFSSLTHILRLVRAGRVIARYDGLVSPQQLAGLPAPARAGLRVAKLFAGRRRAATANPLATALTELGPTYIKLGQFLATRPDLVGRERALELSDLQDRMPAFSQAQAEREVERGLGQPVSQAFETFGPAIAAASIAQVHKATTRQPGGTGRTVAVKVLRPDVEQRFARDMATFAFAARQMQRWHAPSRRLRPREAVATLARSVSLEMDLRMEAAAMSEMAENTREDPGFRVPRVDWSRTSRRVLTTEWIDAIPLTDMARLNASGLDLPQLGDTIIQTFLRHAIRDGFFHADMHQGNLFADDAGNLIAVDFGIMGRLSMKDRRFLAEILYGFITRNYQRVSDVHFDAGYVPARQDRQVFAQALRSIGEPLQDKRAEEISMARLLAQLFQITEQFDMQTQPQLLLLQKTMVVVEGVARMLNPALNMWTAADPVVRQWMEQKLGAQGRIEDAAEGAATLGRLAAAFPDVLADAQRTAQMLAGLAEAGVIPGTDSSAHVQARSQHHRSGPGRMAIWLAAAALVAIAIAQWM